MKSFAYYIKKKGLVPITCIIRDIEGLEVNIEYIFLTIYNFLSRNVDHINIVLQLFVISYVIRNFRGPNGVIFDLEYLENNKHFEKH